MAVEKNNYPKMADHGFPEGSTYPPEMLKTEENKLKEQEAAKQAAQTDDKNTGGGFPMFGSGDDPAQHAMGEEKPEGHNTGPFKGK
jgi:hypothetical protein